MYKVCTVCVCMTGTRPFALSASFCFSWKDMLGDRDPSAFGLSRCSAAESKTPQVSRRALQVVSTGRMIRHALCPWALEHAASAIDSPAEHVNKNLLVQSKVKQRLRLGQGGKQTKMTPR